MERRNEEWQIQEYRSEGNYEGRVSWILKKGLGLGKKMVVSGIVISSAPLVLPSLLVISAIGFVVSIPSGIFLASYACSEKLMSKFLPMPESEEKIEEEEHRGVKRKIESVEGVKSTDEALGDKDVVYVEENGYGEDVGEDLDVEKEKVVVSKEEVPLVDESGGEEPVVVQGVVLDVTAEGGAENGEAAKVEVTTVVVEENGGQEGENGVSEQEKKRETKGLVEETRDEGKADNVEKTPQESTPTSKEDQSAAATEVPVSDVAKESKDAGIASEKEVQTSTPSDEVAYSVEKIWEQIEGLRKIVGYKAPLQKTSIEELKALYIFTGVEPPSSFKEPSDLAEVDSKLQFLKSIIGVN